MQAEVDFMAMEKTERIDGKPDLPVGFFCFVFMRQGLGFEKKPKNQETKNQPPQKNKKANKTKPTKNPTRIKQSKQTETNKQKNKETK